MNTEFRKFNTAQKLVSSYEALYGFLQSLDGGDLLSPPDVYSEEIGNIVPCRKGYTSTEVEVYYPSGTVYYLAVADSAEFAASGAKSIAEQIGMIKNENEYPPLAILVSEIGTTQRDTLYRV